MGDSLARRKTPVDRASGLKEMVTEVLRTVTAEKDAPEERGARMWRGDHAAKRTRQKSAKHDHGAE